MKLFALLMAVAFASGSQAALLDFLKPKTNATSAATPSLAGLSQDQIADGLKQALAKGVQTAVTNLAKPGGFLDNPKVKIPMPEKLATVDKTLRALKQDKYADEFVATMNHAAEQAVPQALPIFTDALKAMTMDDAKQLLSGGNDSATLFFKAKGDKRIQEMMLPIVKQATEKAGVTSAYKKLLEQAGGGNSFLGKLNLNTASLDVDSYVTQKATDGLFKMIAEEEKLIRENPAARTTELLQKVFGAK